MRHRVLIVAVVTASLAACSEGDAGDTQPRPRALSLQTMEPAGATSTTVTTPPADEPEGVSTEGITLTSTEPVTDVACWNSFDTACGPVSFSPVPTNQPISYVITTTPEHPRGGEKVTITVTVTDPDAVPVVCTTPDYDTGDPPQANCAPPRADPLPRGPWSPPAPSGATRTFTFTHVYDDCVCGSPEPIPHEFALSLQSSTDDWAAYPDPYSSSVIARATIPVTPALPVAMPWL